MCDSSHLSFFFWICLAKSLSVYIIVHIGSSFLFVVWCSVIWMWHSWRTFELQIAGFYEEGCCAHWFIGFDVNILFDFSRVDA